MSISLEETSKMKNCEMHLSRNSGMESTNITKASGKETTQSYETKTPMCRPIRHQPRLIKRHANVFYRFAIMFKKRRDENITVSISSVVFNRKWRLLISYVRFAWNESIMPQ